MTEASPHTALPPAPAALARVSVLLGLVVGTIVALFVPGMVDWSHVTDAAWFAVVTPFHFGLPTFEVFSIISMLVVGLVIMTETTGDMIAVAVENERDEDNNDGAIPQMPAGFVVRLPPVEGAVHLIPVFAVSRFTRRQIDWPTT